MRSANNNFGIKPLPNLETRFVAANTLIGLQLSEALPLLQDDDYTAIAKEIEGIREKYFLANNRKQKLDLEKLRRKSVANSWKTELESQRTKWMESQEREIERRVAQLPNPEHRKQLLEEEQKAYKLRKKNLIPTLKMLVKSLAGNPTTRMQRRIGLSPEWMFGITDGFDVVIGNPPYIGERKNEKIFHQVTRTEFGKKFYTRWMDYFYFFVHRSLDVGKRKSIIAFITTNYFINRNRS